MPSIFGSELQVIPAELEVIKSGSQWCWEPLKIRSRCYVRVEGVTREIDGHWRVLATAISDGYDFPIGTKKWITLPRFVESAVLLKEDAYVKVFGKDSKEIHCAPAEHAVEWIIANPLDPKFVTMPGDDGNVISMTIDEFMKIMDDVMGEY